jgi:hypothetical protein
MTNFYAQMFSRSRLKRHYSSPEELAAAAAEYFEWCEDHPLQEEKLFQNQGLLVRGEVAKVRAFTKQGLCAHLGIPVSRLALYKERGEDWAELLETIESVIFAQKFENAAAGLLNPGLIARDLGIADRNEVSGPEGGAIQMEDVTQRDAELFTRSITRLAAALGTAEGDGGAHSGA